jgi:chorismate mutase
MQKFDLGELRSNLIRQEETIIFALIERAQFRRNEVIYRPGGIEVPGFDGCFTDYLLRETEVTNARIRRYTSPDEQPFFADLPEPILPLLEFPEWIKANRININNRILTCYKEQIVPAICMPGDDENYGSCATGDVACLQALSKRIHYGKFIAEAKYQAEPEIYGRLIAAGDGDGLWQQLTDAAVEQRLQARVKQKAAAYGRDIDGESPSPRCRIAPATIAHIYAAWIVPMTKEVEVAYLLERRPDADEPAPADGASMRAGWGL